MSQHDPGATRRVRLTALAADLAQRVQAQMLSAADRAWVERETKRLLGCDDDAPVVREGPDPLFRDCATLREVAARIDPTNPYGSEGTETRELKAAVKRALELTADGLARAPWFPPLSPSGL